MNKKLLTPLFIAASFLLIGCSADKIVARPKWIDDYITTDKSLKDNKLKEIYDAIKELGDTNANVLNKVMYNIAQKQLGHFEDEKDGNKIIHVGIKTIANGAATIAQIDDFVNTYPIYKSEDKAYQLNATSREISKKDISKDTSKKREISKGKIIRQYNRIMDNVYESLFNEIKGGDYSSKTDKLFQEEYFIQHLYKEMYITDPTILAGPFISDRVFIPRKIDESWEHYVNASSATSETGFLQVTVDNDFTDYYKEYVNRKVLPEIYRTLLIENYVKEQRYTNLGRSYARKVKMVTVPHNSDPSVDADIRTMLQSFADNITSDTLTAKYVYEDVTDAMNGFAPTTSTAKALLDNGGFETLKLQAKTEDQGEKEIELTWNIRTDEKGLPSSGETTLVYKGTKLYELVEKYLKFMDPVWSGTAAAGHFDFYKKNYLTSDELTAYNDITSNGTISIEKGLVLKEREIRLNSMTTDGWFLKSGGLTDLKDEFRNKLFNIKTAQIIDDESKIIAPNIEAGDTIRFFGSTTPDSKGRYSSRRAFLFDSMGADTDAHSIVLSDKDLTNYYIVEVLEAGSASKFSEKDEEGSYLRTKATINLGDSNITNDEIVSKVTKEVASGETYKKNAEQYYLMISNIIFYDQSVYDYFKSQFPELFK